MTSAVAAAGVYLLVSFAPFETMTPLLRLPGQALTNVELVLLAALAAWAGAALWSRHRPDIPPIGRAFLLLVAAMAMAAAMAPVESRNAWHMTGRLGAAAAILLLTVDGITTPARLEQALATSVIAGVVVAAAAILEFAQVGPVLGALERFRPSVNVVGAHVRAGGTLQYPTIASMYLEILFAFGVGLMLHAVARSRRYPALFWLAAALLIGEAIVLTFTRAGLLAMGTTLVFALAAHVHQRGIDAGVAFVVGLSVALAALLVASRTTASWWLRLTSDGQSAWYRAAIVAPAALSMTTDRPGFVTLSVTNTGRAAWDSAADPPIVLSYHWLRPDDDGVVAFEGERTAFERRIAPGESAQVNAFVRAPQYPGQYRLEWDLAQEGRLWFSTEPEAPPTTISCVSVAGPVTGTPPASTPHPRRTVRPGRLVLWRAAARIFAAHPLLGVGPDNFRLLYGGVAGLAGADPRTHSNNMYLEILVGGGLVGAAAFAWLLREGGRAIRIASRSADPRLTGIAAALVAIAVHGLVDSFLSFAPTYILFAITLGLATAAADALEIVPDAHRV
jgi:hypothetical protein